MQQQIKTSPDIVKTASLLLNIMAIAALIVTTTLTVQKTQSYNENRLAIGRIITAMDLMKDVDEAAARQIVELRGSTNAEIMLINERIYNVTKLLEEIKTIVKEKL